MTPEIDAAIANAWPDEWAKANNPKFRNRSKARNNLRRAWKNHCAIEEMKRRCPSMSCFTCGHNNKMPHDDRRQCEFNEDSGAYQLITHDNPCLYWKPGGPK